MDPACSLAGQTLCWDQLGHSPPHSQANTSFRTPQTPYSTVSGTAPPTPHPHPAIQHKLWDPGLCNQDLALSASRPALTQDLASPTSGQATALESSRP